MKIRLIFEYGEQIQMCSNSMIPLSTMQEEIKPQIQIYSVEELKKMRESEKEALISDLFSIGAYY